MRQCPPTLLPWRQSISGASGGKGTYTFFFAAFGRKKILEFFCGTKHRCFGIMRQWFQRSMYVRIIWRVCSMYTWLEALLYNWRKSFQLQFSALNPEPIPAAAVRGTKWWSWWCQLGVASQAMRSCCLNPDFPHSKNWSHCNPPVVGAKNRLKLKYIKHTSSMASFDGNCISCHKPRSYYLYLKLPPFFSCIRKGSNRKQHGLELPWCNLKIGNASISKETKLGLNADG